MIREKRIWAAVKQIWVKRIFFFFSRQEIYTCSYTFIAKRKELKEEVRDLEKPVKKARPWMGKDRAQVEIPHSLSLGRY